MSKNNPVWPKVKQLALDLVAHVRVILGRLLLIGAGSSIVLYSMYMVAFGGWMNVRNPSAFIIVFGCIGLLGIMFMCLVAFMYFILRVVPFIWNGFNFRDLKL